LEKMGIVSPVLGVTAEYKSMSRFGETVEIETKMTYYNGVKFSLFYTIRDKATGVLRCTGESRHCFLNDQGTPLSLKRSYPEVHEIFERMCARGDS